MSVFHAMGKFSKTSKNDREASNSPGGRAE